MLLTASDALASPASPSRARFKPRNLLAAAALLVALVGVFVWVNLPAPAVNLGTGNHWQAAHVMEHWRKGEVVVLLRHAERCDRSSNPCLAEASGITIEGSNMASAVGQELKHLGLATADIYTSPLTRTTQTASFMFGKTVASQPWLEQCKTAAQKALLSHKSVGRNLVLVTHSGCINELAQQLNASGASHDSQYASALFVSVDKDSGKPSLLGFLNADDWATVTQEAGI